MTSTPPETVPDQKRRGRPAKAISEAGTLEQEKAAESHTDRPSKVDKAARDRAPHSILDKVSRGGKDTKGKEKRPGGAPAANPGKATKPPKAAPAKEPVIDELPPHLLGNISEKKNHATDKACCLWTAGGKPFNFSRMRRLL